VVDRSEGAKNLLRSSCSDRSEGAARRAPVGQRFISAECTKSPRCFEAFGQGDSLPSGSFGQGDSLPSGSFGQADLLASGSSTWCGMSLLAPKREQTSGTLPCFGEGATRRGGALRKTPPRLTARHLIDLYRFARSGSFSPSLGRPRLASYPRGRQAGGHSSPSDAAANSGLSRPASAAS
jgi:hypothetical protein